MYKGSRSFLTEWHDRTCSICGSTFPYPRHAYDRIEKAKTLGEHGSGKKLSASQCLHCFNGNKITGSHYSLFGITERIYFEILHSETNKEDLLKSLISISYSSGVRNAMRTGPRAEYINQLRFKNALDGYVKDHVNSMSVQAFYWIVFSLEDMLKVDYKKLTWEQQMKYAESRKVEFTKFFESMGTQMYVTPAQNSELARTVQGTGTLAKDYVKILGRGLKQRGGYYSVEETENLIRLDCIGDVYGTIDVIKERFLMVHDDIKSKENFSGEKTTKKGFCRELRDKEINYI